MKFINYSLLQGVDNDGNARLLATSIEYSENNLIIAQNEAYNGEYSIVDIDVEDIVGVDESTEPTTDDVLNVLLGVG